MLRASPQSVYFLPSSEEKRPRRFYTYLKRAADVVLAFSLLPALLALAAALGALNPFLNQGTLFICQTRMGKDCQPFRMWKFRTMVDSPIGMRPPEAAVETHRITPLGRYLRHCRLDEFPQIINVLAGDMSFIGPRPDLWEHAVYFSRTIPRYAARYAVRPGITGLSQVTLGYAVGSNDTIRKVRRDLLYISRLSPVLEGRIILRTLLVILRGAGS